MKDLITLTNENGKPIMIGVPQIIDVHEVEIEFRSVGRIPCTKIKSVGAMVETNYVLETIEQIQKLINE
jgi:hypothetical protein